MRKVALVTGASSGLGAQFARQLASKGYSLVLNGRQEERLESLAKELRENSSIETYAIPLDLSQPEAPIQLFERTVECTGRIDMLVNNAGVSLFGPFLDAPLTKHSHLLFLNANAPMSLSYLAANHMKNLGSQCYILNIGSVASRFGTPNIGTYCASKSFVETFSEALSIELRRTNIRVLHVSLGGVDTEIFERSGAPLSDSKKSKLMKPEFAVKKILGHLDSEETSITIGFSTRVKSAALKMLPTKVLTHFHSK